MPIGNVFEHLPNVLPEGEIVVEDEQHEFTVLDYGGSTSTKYVYHLDKAPVVRVDRVEGVVDGSPYVFEENTDYEVVDDTGDGEIDSIDFSIGGEQPDDNSQFFVTYVAESIISRYVDEHESEVDVADLEIDEVIDSHQVDNATGSELDRIGAIFGQLGKRRGRPDDEYRSFLKSVVQSFKGRGTVPGLKFAIAAGVGGEPDDIAITEDFDAVGYTITITNVDTSFITSAVNDLAQLADPSGVELLQAPIIVSEIKSIDIEKDESVVTEEIGLGGGTLALDGSQTLGGL